jgi:hypothetical protein
MIPSTTGSLEFESFSERATPSAVRPTSYGAKRRVSCCPGWWIMGRGLSSVGVGGLREGKGAACCPRGLCVCDDGGGGGA